MYGDTWPFHMVMFFTTTAFSGLLIMYILFTSGYHRNRKRQKWPKREFYFNFWLVIWFGLAQCSKNNCFAFLTCCPKNCLVIFDILAEVRYTIAASFFHIILDHRETPRRTTFPKNIFQHRKKARKIEIYFAIYNCRL